MSTTIQPAHRLSRWHLPPWQAAIATIVISMIAGAVMYGIARIAGAMPQSVLVSTLAGEEPITLAPVLLISAQSALVASLVHALLRRFTSQPDRNLWIIGSVVLAFSLAPVFTIAEAPARMIAALIVMHIGVGLAILISLTTLVRPPANT